MNGLKRLLRILWVKAMHTGANLGCHQMPERSLFIGAYQFPVCARCTGAFVGQILAIILLIAKALPPIPVCAAFMLLMFVDWGVQFMGWIESNNWRRIITGIMGGLGCWGTLAGFILALIRLK